MPEFSINVSPEDGCVTLMYKIKLPLSWTTIQIVELMEANGLMLDGITVKELGKLMKTGRRKKKP